MFAYLYWPRCEDTTLLTEKNLTIRCWRCGARKVAYDTEELEDKTVLPFYKCGSCNSTWYSVEDIAPYFMRLKNRLRELEGNNPILKGEQIPEGMTRARPQ